MDESAYAAALHYLGGHHVMTLGTWGEDGPWAAAVFYASRGTDLYFLSSPTSRHGRNMAAYPRVAATIQEDYRDWRDIRGIQLEGEVTRLQGDEAKAARLLYAEKFPVAAPLAQAPAPIVQALAQIAWYRLRPERLFYIDNGKGFGHRDEIWCP
jgi:uncharacterized protein YhbP (UPF0306 family)